MTLFRETRYNNIFRTYTRFLNQWNGIFMVVNVFISFHNHKSELKPKNRNVELQVFNLRICKLGLSFTLLMLLSNTFCIVSLKQLGQSIFMDKNVSLENRTHNNSHSRHKTYGFLSKQLFLLRNMMLPQKYFMYLFGDYENISFLFMLSFKLYHPECLYLCIR